MNRVRLRRTDLGRLLRRRIDLAPAAYPAAAALLATGLALAVLEVWKGSFSAPWTYSEDALQNLFLIKAVIDHGWYLHNTSLAFPFGQHLQDFPVIEGDTVHVLLVKLIAVFTSNPALVANVFFVLTFPLTALVTYWALRRLDVSPSVSAACAVLYALLPYHFIRGETHLFLAGYFGMPLGVSVALGVLLGKPLLTRDPGDQRRVRSWLTRTSLATIGACVFVALSEVYYATFTLVLLGAAILLTALRGRRADAVRGLVAAAVIVVVVAAQHVPTLIYHAEHGANVEVAHLRSPFDSEFYGLRPLRLVLPIAHHRLAPLASLPRRYGHSFTDTALEGPSEALGVVSTLGLVWILLGALAVAVRAVPGPSRSRWLALEVAAGVLALVALVVATADGLSAGIALFISDAIRSWNRMSVALAFLGLVGVAALLDRLRVRTAPRRRGALIFAAMLTALVAVGTLDQTSPFMVPHYREVANTWNQDTALVSYIESRLPSGSAVLELPYYPLPEYGYEQARGYIHSHKLRWSWGGMAGRPEDWQAALLGKPPSLILPVVVATGFGGIFVNAPLYPDPVAFIRDMSTRVGAPPVATPDGRLAFFDLRRYAARLYARVGPAVLQRLADSALHPVRPLFGSNWGAMILDNNAPASLSRWRWMHVRSGSLELENPRQAPVRATFTASVATNGPDAATVGIVWPDGARQSLRAGADGTPVRHVLVLRPGTSEIHFTSSGGTGRDPTSGQPGYLRLVDYTLTDSIQQRFESGRVTRAG